MNKEEGEEGWARRRGKRGEEGLEEGLDEGWARRDWRGRIG